jgi:hypothetical protein
LFKDHTDARTLHGKPIEKHNKLPLEGIDKSDILASMDLLSDFDVKPEKGNVFAYVYHNNTDPDFYEFLKQAHNKFMEKNALNPSAFPSLRVIILYLHIQSNNPT